jgi:hypothetical protein
MRLPTTVIDLVRLDFLDQHAHQGSTVETAELQDELGNVSGDWTMKPREPSFYKKLTKRNVPLPDGFFNSTQAE